MYHIPCYSAGRFVNITKSETHKVTERAAEQPDGSQNVDSTADISNAMEDVFHGGVPLLGGRRALHGGRGVRHPGTKVKLRDTGVV